MAVVLTGVLCASSVAAPYATSFDHASAPAKSQKNSNGGVALDTERVIAVHQLPAPVHAALTSLGKGIRILEVKENIDQGRATYEIDLLRGNVYYELELDAVGTMIDSEIEAWIVPLFSLPDPARRAIENEAGGAMILEVRMEQEEDSGDTVYDVDIRNATRTYALRIDARGTLIERDITLEMLPPGAYLALIRAAQGGTIVELDEELHDGQLSYEANIVIGNVEFEISVDADGNVVELNYP